MIEEKDEIVNYNFKSNFDEEEVNLFALNCEETLKTDLTDDDNFLVDNKYIDVLKRYFGHSKFRS